ncbi:MAG: hypothetical protein JXP73_07205 [Deltaproteobacteria bacterium]|nr:hypothetical protein [Deltaproteobacteria bacterium]
MADILIVSNEVSPVAESQTAVCAAALGRALSAAKHRVTILTLAEEDRAAQIPGMARRLRTVLATLADGDRECALFEGRSAISQCALHVLGADPSDRGHRAAFLASAAAALVRDEICRAEAIIAWGEAAAAVLPAVQANARVFVLPAGDWGPPLTQAERAALNPNAPDLAMAGGSLAGLGAIDADVVVFPSPSSAKAFEHCSDFSFRASDQPVVSIRFGCDEAPYDPSTDPALAATYSPEAPNGKAECRRALARRTSLAPGPRTLLLATSPLTVRDGGRALIEALSRLVRSDVAIVVPGVGERAMVDEIRRLAIETPGKIAVYPDDGPTAERQILAAADALLLADENNHLARTAGLSMRYGTLPLAPDAAAYRDHLVDFDLSTRTGTALLYQPDDPYERVSVVLRASSLRGNLEAWQDLPRHLMSSAPPWATTAALFENLCASPPTSA